MSEVNISRISSLPICDLGEGPHWDADSGSLVYVDAFKSKVHRFYPATNKHQQLHMDASASGFVVSFVIPVDGEPELFLLSVGRDIGLVRWRQSDPEDVTAKVFSLVTVDQDKPRNGLNDGKCDSKGQLWAGTRGQETSPGVLELEQGSLFCFSSAMKPKRVVDKVHLSNGLTWNADKTQFYYIDTEGYSVDAFDYDNRQDSINNRRKLVDFKTAGLKGNCPDGMTIDTDGNLWVACYGGSKLICVDGRKGGILRTVPLPIVNPTSVCWGGPQYDELYLTTSRTPLHGQEIQDGSDDGALFKITGLGVKGQPANKVKLDSTLVGKMK